jgi:2-succinyl-5-enolpyruvyl-6-hydroxy-3-cyclohexene-1-carboxylate synthase
MRKDPVAKPVPTAAAQPQGRAVHPAASAVAPRGDTHTGSPATDFSVALLDELLRLGVRDVVLSPGSRSQALALAAAELERVGALRLHVRIDERGAGFLALGLAVETGVPAVVVTTSGTAVANLHPAVLEAHHSGVPMVLLTADRPVELRGIRSNQTTVQPGMFGPAIRLGEDVPAPTGTAGESDDARSLARRAMDAATGRETRAPGPVQLNLAFREPLSAAVTLPDIAQRDAVLAAEDDTSADVEVVTAGEPDAFVIPPRTHTVVIAGHGSGPEAEALAREGGWPLIAEVSSGSRFGPNLVVAYRELLVEPEWGGRIERAVVFGHPTLSREVPALIQRADVETIVVAGAGTHEAREWVGRWVMASRRLRDDLDAAESAGPDIEASTSPDYRVRGGFAKSELAALRTPVTRGMLVDAVWRATWPHDRLVIAASRLIREADRRVPGKKITVHSNRGLAGIDGTIATALGIARASQAEPDARSSGITRLLAGDLAVLHDAGSLLIPPGELRPRVQVIVGNDGGGTIFDGLEVAASAPNPALDRVLYTPHAVNLAALAQAHGWAHTLTATRSELERVLTAPVAGPSIVEVPLTR